MRYLVWGRLDGSRKRYGLDGLATGIITNSRLSNIIRTDLAFPSKYYFDGGLKTTRHCSAEFRVSRKTDPVLSLVVWTLKREVRAIRGCLGAYRR